MDERRIVARDTTDSAALSSTLLALCRAAQQPDIAVFQAHALALLRERVPFDGGVWGSGIDSDTRLHQVHTWQVDARILDLINRDPEHNVVPQRCCAQPGVAHVFDGATLRACPAAAWLPDELVGFEQLLGIVAIDSATGLLGSLGLLRRQAAPAFDDQDCRWLELLMPHLQQMMQVAHLSHLHQVRTRSLPPQDRLAITDACGVVHLMEAGFAELLREQWPQWSGPWLPDSLLAAKPARRPRDKAAPPLRVEVGFAAENLLVRVRRSNPLDELSPQEQAVSVAYAGGSSHKEVARALGLAPATVRHHLRRVYAKLAVDDKAALAQRLGVAVASHEHRH